MCLVVFAAGMHERWPLVLAANRDERHARPSLPAAWWLDRPGVFGGRDLVAHGSWLAVDSAGRIAAVTNLPATDPPPAARSRGALVARFVGDRRPLEDLLAELGRDGEHFGPFNLLLFDGAAAVFVSNRAPPVRLPPGIHAVGNAPLDADWPKLHAARHGMRAALAAADPIEPLFELLAARTTAASDDARYRASVFIEGARYGTRCSTVIVVDAAGELSFIERSFDATGARTGERRERFRIEPSSSTGA